MAYKGDLISGLEKQVQDAESVGNRKTGRRKSDTENGRPVPDFNFGMCTQCGEPLGPFSGLCINLCSLKLVKD
jgi:hypothetical protein